MVWSKWKKTIVASVAGMGLAWSGLAWTQQPAPTGPTVGPNDRIISFQEEGNPPSQAVILKQWQQPDGSNAYQVQDLGTQEIHTIYSKTLLTSAPAGAPPA